MGCCPSRPAPDAVLPAKLTSAPRQLSGQPLLASALHDIVDTTTSPLAAPAYAGEPSHTPSTPKPLASVPESSLLEEQRPGPLAFSFQPCTAEVPKTPTASTPWKPCSCKVPSKKAGPKLGKHCTVNCGCAKRNERCVPGRCGCTSETCGNDAQGEPDTSTAASKARTPRTPTAGTPTVKRKFVTRVGGNLQDAELNSLSAKSASEGKAPPFLSLLKELLRDNSIKRYKDSVVVKHGGDYSLRRTDARVQRAMDSTAGPSVDVDHVWECQLQAHSIVQASRDEEQDRDGWRHVLSTMQLPDERPTLAEQKNPPMWTYYRCQLKNYRDATRLALQPLFDVQNSDDRYAYFNLRMLDSATNRKKGQLFKTWLDNEYAWGENVPAETPNLQRQLSGYLTNKDKDGAVASSSDEADAIAANITAMFKSTAETYIKVVENGLDASAIAATGRIGGPQRAERRYQTLAATMESVKQRALGLD